MAAFAFASPGSFSSFMLRMLHFILVSNSLSMVTALGAKYRADAGIRMYMIVCIIQLLWAFVLAIDDAFVIGAIFDGAKFRICCSEAGALTIYAIVDLVLCFLSVTTAAHAFGSIKYINHETELVDYPAQMAFGLAFPGMVIQLLCSFLNFWRLASLFHVQHIPAQRIQEV